jgi:hypothetical protein
MSQASELMVSAKCYCFPPKFLSQVVLYLVHQWALTAGIAESDIVLEDSDGAFWRLILRTDGTLGTQTDAGPATDDIVLDDGGGGFWLVIVATDGLHGLEEHVGPATVAPTITDANDVVWTLVAATDGVLGTDNT